MHQQRGRMHEGRHRKMTQGLLDLKRLYWNLHQFRAGHRKQTPYGLLGLKLPALSFWELLRMTPEELRKHFRYNDVPRDRPVTCALRRGRSRRRGCRRPAPGRPGCLFRRLRLET